MGFGFAISAKRALEMPGLLTRRKWKDKKKNREEREKGRQIMSGAEIPACGK